MRERPERLARKAHDGAFVSEVWRLFLFSRVLHVPPPRERDRR